MGIVLESSAVFPKSQRVLIDTNVLYWLTYASSRVFPRALKPREYQLEKYPQLFERLLENQNIIYFSSYSVSELANIISRVEASLNGRGQEHERKKWLRTEGGREIVVRELTTVIETIESWAKIVETKAPMNPKEYLQSYSKFYLDGYDIYLQDDLSKNEIRYLLTDDIDFTSVRDLHVITANTKAGSYSK